MKTFAYQKNLPAGTMRRESSSNATEHRSSFSTGVDTPRALRFEKVTLPKSRKTLTDKTLRCHSHLLNTPRILRNSKPFEKLH